MDLVHPRNVMGYGHYYYYYCSSILIPIFFFFGWIMQSAQVASGTLILLRLH